MPILLDDKTYQIDPNLLIELASFADTEYGKLDEGLRFAGKAISREMLRRMEKQVREKTGDDKKALSYRPDKKADATLFLIDKIFVFMGLFLEHATLRVRTGEGGSIVGVTIENPTGRPMAPDGNIGQRENDRSQIS